ncbi:Hypothetical predicted protein [Paramuricea clavata]|uniref:Uncharacterized protein n=1 Tax=Paramuricea clavata TaxID=317549 RepID=A0A6S7GES8_PARCT|nr:Hypothetical predicted protein [Paramuricea clavata]
MAGIDQEADIGDIQDFPEDITEEDLENIGEESNEDFNLNAIKVRLIAEDLYGPEINNAVKNASCNKAFFDAVLPLYDKFCRKRNQDKLLEAFYGLIPNSRQYLNCPDSNAANLIMIEIPDHLAGFFKVCQHRKKATTTSDLKLDPSERGPLSYIAGYIVSKLYQKTRSKNQNECDEELQALLQALKSTESDNNFILARSRGGLVSPSHHLMGIVEEAEICFRKNAHSQHSSNVIYYDMFSTQTPKNSEQIQVGNL